MSHHSEAVQKFQRFYVQFDLELNSKCPFIRKMVMNYGGHWSVM